MKLSAFILPTAATLSTFILGTGADIANASHLYWSAAPTQSIPSQTGSPWYITSSIDGIDFYGGNNYIHTITADSNLFVTALVITDNGDNSASGMYLQIDCGRLNYKPLSPWMTVTSDSWNFWEDPLTYDWREFSEGSALEVVGQRFCEEAAVDRGIEWVWYR